MRGYSSSSPVGVTSRGTSIKLWEVMMEKGTLLGPVAGKEGTWRYFLGRSNSLIKILTDLGVTDLTRQSYL